MRPSQFLRAAPRGMLASVAIAFVLLCGLGVWQLYRLAWKEQLIADMARTEAMPPVPVQDIIVQSRPAWRSVTLPECTLVPGKLIHMHSEVDGVPGYRLLAACPLDGGQSLLVDLGFAESRIALESPQPFTPVGRLRPADKPSAFAPVNRPADNDWYTRATPEIAKALGEPLRGDYFLVLDLKPSRLALPGLRQGPLSAPLPNRHFEYALTWFGLAFAMMGIFIAFVMQVARTKAE